QPPEIAAGRPALDPLLLRNQREFRVVAANTSSRATSHMENDRIGNSSHLGVEERSDLALNGRRVSPDLT
ncbi:MAG: hypothetical protein ACTSYE_11960, partial [Alphaproteobacteria bacterium]